MKRIARSAIVEHPARAVYALVEDIEAYPRFLPWCRGVEVRSREAGRTVATPTPDMRGLSQTFTTENSNVPGESIRMRLVEGPFRSFSAEWRFVPLAEHASRVEFSLEYEFASRALGKLLGPLFNAIADSMVDAFKRRADEVHGHAAR